MGTVTPFGQAAPGLHLFQVLWLTRQGAIPAPSPFGTVILNGGQYVSVSNIPIGPPSVIARILAFTGAQPDVPGVLPPFFYIPVTPQLEGQIIGTSTVINDNTSTTAFLDFSDNTLFAATGISIPGNNLANQIVLDGALTFSTYLSRLLTNGQRNVIQNLLNLGFEGGYNANSPNSPLGWGTSQGSGALVDAHFGVAWQVSILDIGEPYGGIVQSGYLDAYGDPIFVGNQTYSIRFWAVTNGAAFIAGFAPVVRFEISSASTGFFSLANVNLGNPTQAAYYEADFSAPLPTDVPSDLVFSMVVEGASTTGLTVTIDDIQPIFAETPYLDDQGYASYVTNPEGFDGDTGVTGPDDTSKLMVFSTVRGTLCALTEFPSGRLWETNGSTNTEPSGWDWKPIGGQCGILSAFALTRSQADDGSEAGGDQWIAWASDVGAMIYGGGLPEKISQEIQPNWNDPAWENSNTAINLASASTAWALNDPVEKWIMFGLPIGPAYSSPSQIYVLNYQHLGSAESIASSPPYHPSLGGKLIATDNSRKWTHWLRSMNGAARMYRGDGGLSTCFFNGNGNVIGEGQGTGHIYTLNPTLLVDDDYGQIDPYYTTCFLIDPEKRQALGLKGGRLLLAYVLAQIQPKTLSDTNSQVTLSYFGDSLSNLWPLSTTRTLTQNFYKDRNFGGGMAQGERIAIKISSSPIIGTANGFTLSRFSPFFKNAKLRISGVNQ